MKKSRPVTPLDIQRKKIEDERLTMLTAYDYPSASLVEKAGVDMVLVGDSVSNVVQGNDSTIPVTLSEMVYHTRLVTRALCIADMPFGSYPDAPTAMRAATRLVKEGGAHAVKLEGGSEQKATIVEAVVEAGIPVMGHLGLTPQTVTQLGGYRVQGREVERAREILEGARRLQQAGIFSLVLECVPDELARVVTDELEVPTIGIGAGPACDGQVLVFHDLLGLYQGKVPRAPSIPSPCPERS
jgi:3-methyl-2-oxobutanoate hydroxymethyltransferase